MSSGRQLTPGFPCHAAPAALPVKPAARHKACGLGEGFSSSQRKAFVLGPHPSPPLASSVILAKSLRYLTPISSQVCSAVLSQGVFTGGWSAWVF